MHGVDKSADDRINLYLIKNVLPNIRIGDYFWISIVATGILLALTSIVAFRKLPDPHLIWRIDKLEESMADNVDRIRVSQVGILRDLENNKKAREELGYEPTGLKQGITQTISWYKTHGYL